MALTNERPGQPEVGDKVPGHRRAEDHAEGKAGTGTAPTGDSLLAVHGGPVDPLRASGVLVVA
jgi:hypothetical protein